MYRRLCLYAEWDNEGPVDSTVVITLVRNGRKEAHSWLLRKKGKG